MTSWPLLLGMGLLMLGAGLQGTLTGVRATQDGFATFVTGLVMSCYYVGYMTGSVCAPRLVQRVGHIRVFATMSSIAAATILLQAAFVAPVTWAGLRFVSGFCFAGIYVVAESWLNDRATNQNRGSLLALYMAVLYVGLGTGQFLLNLADTAGPALFMLVSALISLAAVPMTLSVQRAPEFEIPRKIAFQQLFRVSPLGVVGVIVSGVVTSCLFAIGPVYAQLIGLDATDTATFMGVSILAAMATQFPIGRLSDRVDRRSVLTAVCIAAAVIAIAALMFATMSKAILFVLAAAFGGIALTLYSLSLSHINDHLEPEQIVSASASVLLLNGAGSMLGPLLISMLMSAFGAVAYFGSLAVLVASLGLYAVWRKGRRAAVPTDHKIPFVTAQPQAVGHMLADVAQQRVGARDDVH